MSAMQFKWGSPISKYGTVNEFTAVSKVDNGSYGNSVTLHL